MVNINVSSMPKKAPGQIESLVLRYEIKSKEEVKR